LADGQLLVAGTSSDGRLGFDAVGIFSSPRSILSDVSNVALGELGGVGTLTSGELFVFGKTRGHTVEPQVVEVGDMPFKISQVARGRAHIVMADQAGNLYSMVCRLLPLRNFHLKKDTIPLTTSALLFLLQGDNTEGCLGLGHRESEDQPQLVTALNKLNVTSVACGRDFTLCATRDGAVYSWGSDEHGAAAHGKADRRILTPKRVTSIAREHIVQVAAGENHSMVLCANGRVWTAVSASFCSVISLLMLTLMFCCCLCRVLAWKALWAPDLETITLCLQRYPCPRRL